MPICEVYVSVSNKDVVRGMHFQTPPYEHNKIVFVQEGFIKDVVLDLRKTSPTYGKCFSIELNENSNIALFIPKGLAHGFASLENNSRILYIQDSVYSYECDCGVLYDSFNFDWGIGNPILSDRDKGFEKFLEYKTPF